MTDLVRERLATTLRGRSVNPDAVAIDNILLRNIDLPPSIDEAIANVQRQRQATAASTQANLTAQQEAARALTVANGDAAALIARTEADARMLRIRSEAQAAANRTLSASLTPEFLAYERIQATRAVLQSNGTRTVFLPGATAPAMLMNPAQ
jgi:regulator of protease activity HflC (stomatin/prohibitin superfamily)